ncbi:Niemann-Pick C1 protein [Folsomia candida]|uniref:Niemann-Pick C1 protein n=1 Tax=Folsomia candida TaxID=158441 RepID=A0A226EL61_FOLCA|nr:Niemann-Pick C1 protein [Folsomia candida]
MKVILLILFYILNILVQINGQQGIWPDIVKDKEPRCTMYGRCKELPDGRVLTCYTEDPPQKIDDSALKNLTAFCSEMLEMYAGLGMTDLCCRADQIADLTEQLKMPEGIISRCPSCWHNFRQSLCEFTCSPFQAHFVKVAKFWNGTVDNKLVVEDTNFYVTERHANASFDSCRNVMMGTANSLAMDFLCGPWGSHRCTPQRWYDYMGSVRNTYAPFNIFYRLTNDTFDGSPTTSEPNTKTSKAGEPLDDLGITPYDGDTYLCNTSPPKSTKNCSCVDCTISCPAGAGIITLPQKKSIDDWEIASIFGMYFIMGIVFLVGSILIILGACFALYRERREQPSRLAEKAPGTLHRWGMRSEKMINRFFSSLGQVCAENPWPVLIPGFCLLIIPGILITGALSCGIVYLDITTDPVELWASPNSRSRQEKEYYDKNFSPFYRTEQIIATAKGLPSIMYYPSNNTREEPEHFGPIFNKEFMYALLDLQERIVNDVRGENGEQLSDVCFSPLSPENTNCTIFSYLEFWHSNPKNFEKVASYDAIIGEEVVTLTDSYLDHFLFCSRNPGAPKDSTELRQTLLGGFLEDGQNLIDPPYQNATTAVITFIVNNKYSKDDTRPAREWEKAYVEFMKKYLEIEKPSFMDIAFSSERSIEGKVSRISKV